MNVSLARTSALVALLVASSAVSAFAATAGVDPQSAAVAIAAPEFTVVTTATASDALAPSLEIEHVTVPETSLLGVHYRPRSSGWGRHVDSQTVSQFHLGFFDPEGPPSREFLIGLRGGAMLDPHVQLGLGFDWSHLTSHQTSSSHQSIGPNGYNPTVWQDVSQSASHLFTVMPYVQVSGDDHMPVIPFAGIGGGYEVLYLSQDDYIHNNSWSATYGGWGWQIWAGAALPLSGQVRVNGEVFLNQSEPSRDVTDNLLGTSYRERVNTNGSGLRLGMAWGF